MTTPTPTHVPVLSADDVTTDRQQALYARLCAESVPAFAANTHFMITFAQKDDETALITRAIQEPYILETRVQGKPSFMDVWRRDERLRSAVWSAPDKHEAKWSLAKRYGYRMATTFMPAYAKAIYAHFDAKRVLDPCAGWGDRMLGAMAAGVDVYVGFDPNRALQPGYEALRLLSGRDFVVHPAAFETSQLEPDSFDLVFTSPPFFDFEVYSDDCPRYDDWIRDFYRPLLEKSCAAVKTGGHVAIHIEDTSAGRIEAFLIETVPQITSLRFLGRIGLRGGWSGQLRPVWVYVREK